MPKKYAVRDPLGQFRGMNVTKKKKTPKTKPVLSRAYAVRNKKGKFEDVQSKS